MKTSYSLIFITLLIFISNHVDSQDAKSTWTTNTVAITSTSQQPVICSDSLGHLHVAWSDGEALLYASNQFGDWGYFRQVDGYSSTDTYVPVITADAYGWAYLAARFYVSGHRVKYATNKEIPSGFWTRTTQMSSGHYHEVSIEVDNTGGVHVFAQEDTYGSNVYYQNFDPADVVIAGGTSQFYSTTIDKDNVLHFAGSHANSIWYTNNASGSWSSELDIDGMGESTGQPSIICDTDGYLHLLYIKVSTSEIYYTNNTGGSWVSPVQTGGSGIWPDIVIDENGVAHVAYHTIGGGLYYMNNSGGSWNTPEFISAVSLPDDVAHVDSKIALDLKKSTVNIVYITGGNTITVASTDDYELRNLVGTDRTSTITSNAGTPTIDTISVSATGTITLLEFTVSDSGGDGEPTGIEEFVFHRGLATSHVKYLDDYFQSMILEVSDASSIACELYAYKSIAGTKNAVWKNIPEGGSLSFTLKGTLKEPLVGITDSTFQIMINGLYDVITNNNGSGFSVSNGNIISDTLYFMLSGFEGSGTLVDPYLINDLNDLEILSETSDYWDKHFKQTADIDAYGTSSWNSGEGYSPIGEAMSGLFSGSYDGDGHIIDGLFLNPNSIWYTGLFGQLSGTVTNLGLTNVNITGADNVGGVAGQNSGTISNCFVSGSISGNSIVGGIAGFSNGSIISCYNSAEINSSAGIAGGLAGYQFGNSINNCYSTGTVIRTGGLSAEYGGFCGRLFNGTISTSYSRGNVFDSDGITSFATNLGFAGMHINGIFTNNLFDNEATNQLTAIGANPASTLEMKTYTTFYNKGWDFIDETDNGTDDIWGLSENDNEGYPFLEWQGYLHEQVDKLPPDLITKNTILALDGTGNATLKPSDVVTSASDNVTLKDTILSKYDFTTADLGDQTIDVTVHDISDNSTTKTAVVTVTTTTAVDIIEENLISYYPNPVKNSLNIDMGSLQAKSLKVFDVTGRLISETKNPPQTINIDMSDFQNGVYFINIEDETAVSIIRIIKN